LILQILSSSSTYNARFLLISLLHVIYFLQSQIVNGPEVLSKFVGETEKNVRDLFADAENEQRTRGMFSH
jgi:hypothetical protein